MGNIGKATEPRSINNNQWQPTQVTDIYLTVLCTPFINRFMYRQHVPVYDLKKRRGDCLIKWLIMLGFIDLRGPRVCQRSTPVLYTPVTGCTMVWHCCLSLCPSIHICPSVHPPICLPVRPSILSVAVHTDICTWVLYTCHRLYYGMALLSVSLSIHPSIHSHLPACASTRPSVHLVYLCLYRHKYMSFIHPSQVVSWYGAAVCLSVHPSSLSFTSACPSTGVRQPKISSVCWGVCVWHCQPTIYR